MSSEAPFISKALRLVTFALVIGIVALALSVGFSANQEYQVLVGGNSSSSGGNGTHLIAVTFANESLITTLTVPNKMAYNISLGLSENIIFAGTRLAAFSFGPFFVPPGQIVTNSSSVPFNFTSLILKSSSTFETVLFSPQTLTVATNLQTSIVPLFGMSVAQSINSTMPAIFSGLKVGCAYAGLTTCVQNTTVNGASFYKIPMALSWNNSNPLTFNGTVTGNVVQVPNHTCSPSCSANSTALVVPGNTIGEGVIDFLFPASGPDSYTLSQLTGQLEINFVFSTVVSGKLYSSSPVSSQCLNENCNVTLPSLNSTQVTP